MQISQICSVFKLLSQIHLHMADGQSKSFFYPFSGVTDELKTFLSDVSTANLKVKRFLNFSFSVTGGHGFEP